jgi:hypothetical protein
MSRAWQDRGQGGAGGASDGRRADASVPGKRTLTEGIVQLKPDNGGSGSAGGQQPGGPSLPPQPSPQPPYAGDDPHKPDPKQKTVDMVSLVVEIDGQFVQVYVSPGGVDQTPDVFMFFHGHRANLGIDKDLTPKPNDNVSGNDSAAAAVQQAQTKNTIVLLPQGVRGGGKDDGGAMKALRGKGSLPKLVDDILADLGPKLGVNGTIVPKHIALAGHSAGGYEGVHDALRTAGKYADTISDITLMDSSYSDTHFEDAVHWMFGKTPGKTIRIVQSEDQMLHSYQEVPDPSDPEKKKTITKVIAPHWRGFFSEAALNRAAIAHKMTISPIQKYDPDSTDDRGNKTRVLQHTQVMNDQSQVQCDILVMQSDLGHHEIRDNVMDDAIDSIGKGAAGSDSFGKNQIAGYGRDPKAPHSGNKEHVPGEPEPPKPTRHKP